MSNDRWNINRVGRAARVTTVPGEVPEYGLAMDLGNGTGLYMTSDQYNAMMRDLAGVTAAQTLQSDPLYQSELQRAQNYQQFGAGVTDADISGASRAAQTLTEDGDTGFTDIISSVPDLAMSGLNMFTSKLGEGAKFIAAGPGAAMDMDDPTYEAYHANGGILSEDDFNSFDEQTRAYLVNNAKGSQNISNVTGLPGVSHTLVGFDKAYRASQTPFIMFGNAGHKNPLATLVDPMWFQRGEWADAWREAQDQSLGNAIVNGILEPYVGQERLDVWKRESGLYQLTSLGTEAGLAWFADPGVIAGKAAGTAARFGRRELPLAEESRFYRSTLQSLQREKITVGGLTGLAGRAQAARIRTGWDKLDEYAKTHSFTDFSALRMFRHRDGDGYAAAHALYWAFRNGDSGVKLADFAVKESGERAALNYPDIKSLTQQLIHHDPKAWQDFNRLKTATTEELNKFAPGAQTYVDAIEALKTKLPTLQKEMDDLARSDAKIPFYQWAIHSKIEDRAKEIEEVKGVLNKYEGYSQWFDDMNKAPMVEQVNARQRLFMDNQFGKTHFFVKMARPIWLKKANTAEMHDVDSGATSIRRIFEGLDHRFKYQNAEALDYYLNRWITASTARERYEVMRTVEERHVIDAAARKYGVSPETIKAVYDKIIAEQNKVIDGIRSGQDSLYSTAPTLGERVQKGDGVRLVSHDKETKTVTLELMESGKHYTVQVPESALTRRGAVDPTQTPNYYNPLDLRRFDIALRQNKSLLKDIDADFLSVGKADVFNRRTVVDILGTKFNQLWKPAVLFRFGWPIRVLMDENMRALSVLGARAFVKYYGPAYSRAMNNATIRTAEAARNTLNLALSSPYLYRATGRTRMNIGPGPLANAQKYAMDPVERDQLAYATPKVPESFEPILDNTRYEKIASAIGDWEIYQRARMGRALGADLEAVEPITPLHKILERRSGEGPGVFHPASARRDNSGFIVAMPHTRISADTDIAELMRWYSQNRELLGSTGYRIHIDGSGNMTIARHFKKGERERAAAMAQFTDGTMVNLRTGVSARFLAREEDVEPEVVEPTPEVLDEDYDFDADLDRQPLIRRRTGVKTRKAKTSDGQIVEYPDAYEGHMGELMRSLISSQGTMEILSEGHGAATNLFRRMAEGHKAYNPVPLTDRARTKGTPENKQALEYFRQWGNLLNSQVAHSPIWNKMLNGWSDEKIVRWLNRTDEGARVRREMKHEFTDTELWVNEHRAKLDYYLPNRKLQRLLSKGKIDMSQLRKEIAEEDFPSVYGPDVELLDKRSQAGRLVGWMADRIWYGLGTLPIDTLSRHPFAKAVYDMKMRSLIRSTDGDWLDQATIDRYEKIARRHTREQVRKTLWDLIDQTDFTDALRFIAPFWGAQQEAIVKWARIVSDRPETVARAYALNNAAYQNFVVIDEDGNPVDRNRFKWMPTDRVVLRIPNVLRKTKLGKALETVGSIGVPLGSANTVLQGETPFLPGPGPIVTVAADKFLRVTNPETYGVQYSDELWYRWLFPIGRPPHGGYKGVIDQVLPGWAKRVVQMTEDGIAYQNLMSETAREMELLNASKGLPPPTAKEIEDQARWVWYLRVFAGLISPVQVQFRPKHQFFIDEAHRYQREYGLGWFDRYIKDYSAEMAKYTGATGAAKALARYAVSSTEAPVGTPPTTSGILERQEHKDLIAEFPEWGEAIISPEAFKDEFNPDAYYAETQIPVGPGDDTRLREPLSQKERFAIGDARAGWYEWRQVDAIIEAQLRERGLHSIQQNGAEDLRVIKTNFIADLTERNPAWRAEYDTFSNDIYARVDELKDWVQQHPERDTRPDLQGVQQYLIIRDQVAAELDRHYLATGGEGSRSLQASDPDNPLKNNTALRMWFYEQVGALAQENPAFAEFYNRYLSQDTLEQGSGGF